MPFKKEFDNTYKLGIRTAVEELGAYCERVDEQEFEGRILDRIYNQIDKADLIIADMSGQNPNVFYEVGYAHALNKKVILLTNSSKDIPFDLKDYPHIIYNPLGISELILQLKNKIDFSFKNPDKQQIGNSTIEIFKEGQKIEEGSVIQYNISLPSRHDTIFESFTIDLKNNSNIIFERPLKLGLELTNLFVTNSEYALESEKLKISSTKQSNQKIIHLIDVKEDILPDCWFKLPLFLRSSPRETIPLGTTKLPSKAVIYSKNGTSTLSFSIELSVWQQE